MNYLGHIHLAHTSDTSMVGNFYGDFIKGSDLSILPIELQKGVRLHRAIDSFTDSHPIVQALRKDFSPSIRKLSGVILDIYFDHVLCRSWQRFSQHEMADVLETFYTQLPHYTLSDNPRLARVTQGLLEHRWLADYQHFSAVERSLYHVESRLKNRIVFAQQATQFLATNASRYDDAFLAFYPDVIDYVSQRAAAFTD